MSAVSILLNLTGCLSYEETDPLMSLVAGKGSLLFYDQLSVRRFPSEKEQYDAFLDNLLSNLRNLLESRALSREDGGGKVRLIVVIDLAGGLFEPLEKGRKCFPSEKVRLFQDRLHRVFGDGNPLLDRFCYSFIFLESTLPADKELVSSYRKSAIDELGTGIPDITGDCSFFLLKFSTTPIAVKRKDELTLTSLVLLLSTISDEDAAWLLDGSGPAAYVLGNVEDNDIDKERLQSLYNVVRECRNKLRAGGDLRKEKNGVVEYKSYEAKTHTMAESDSFARVREKLDNERKNLQAAFKKARRVPFFFGPEPGKWEWYSQTIEAAERLYDFELSNGRPLYDSSRRITEKELVSSTRNCTYSELENEIARISGQEPEQLPAENFDEYFRARNTLLQQFGEGIEKMKVEMLKLGYFFNMAWISLLLSIAFGVTYSFHFFFNHFKDNPLWIGAAFLLSLICFLVGALVSHGTIKRKVEREHLELDKCCNSMNKQMSDFIEKERQRIDQQKIADIRRRNIAEMEAKMNSFNRHNLQVDRWETFFDGLLSRIEDLMGVLTVKRPDSASSANVESALFPLDDFPTMPEELCGDFLGETVFSCFNDKPIRKVLCFIKRFECTKITKQ